MGRWRNWAGDQVCTPAERVEPRSEEALIEAVAHAPGRVRVAGSGHSFSDIALTDGLQVSLAHFDRVLDFDGEGLVRVQGGIWLHELGIELARRRLAMENLGDVDAQTLAGALATGTHGTGVGFRNLSSRVEGMRLVTADGVHDVSDRDDLRAAKVSLGALGVATEIQLRCQPLYTLRRTDERKPLSETLDNLQDLATERERFEFFAFPYARWALWRTTEQTDDAPKPPGAIERFVNDIVLENGVFGALCRVGRALPGLIPPIDRLLGRLAGGGVRIDRSARIYANPRLVHFTEMEYALPRAAGAEAVRGVFDLVERERLPVLFPLEVRFGAPDDAFLSPGAGRDSCYVAVHMYRGMDFEPYFRAVEEIMRGYEGRPHWGKRHFRTAAELSGLYPDWGRFQVVRDRLDPRRAFANDYTDRVLGN
ncbi:MAG: L-gulono,4-lactone dehydrogenase [Thermoleophilaceae bacterium]|nr:L-gulono,4-lactone dehydrogenase [Thermoleophilaceae bacterium]